MTPETEKLEDAIATLEHDLQHCDGSTYANLPVRHVVTCTQAARKYAEVLPLLSALTKSHSIADKSGANRLDLIDALIVEIAAITARGDG